MVPIIVAALPISSTLKVPQLLELLEKVIDGLLEAGLNIISYSCDGTETERSVQKRFTESAPTCIKISIPGPSTDLQIQIPVYNGHPIAMIQDSKHALKTFRNNLYSGATLLVLGNYVATFKDIWDLAHADGTPLYHRDVEKLDRQDDNAASRLFSAPTLAFLEAQGNIEKTGVIIYLFVFAELIDAYQNRVIPHIERIRLVLRAYFFVTMWKKYIDTAPAYASNPRLYFMSRESVDIIQFLVHGLIALIVIHRDHLPDIYPLTPWLHSTEGCEHIFGMARQIIKDFTMLDFIHMVPKLGVKLREVLLNARRKPEEMRTIAAGYNHTYLDKHDIDLLELARFPTELQVTTIASEAAEEAESLILQLGILPSTVVNLPYAPCVKPHFPTCRHFQYPLQALAISLGSQTYLTQVTMKMLQFNKVNMRLVH